MYHKQHRNSQNNSHSPHTSATNQFAPPKFFVQPQVEEGTQEQEQTSKAESESSQATNNNWPDVSMFTYRRAPAPPPRVQMKLKIGAANDQYEQEADQVAQDVVQRLHTPQDPPVENKEQTDNQQIQTKALINVQRQEKTEQSLDSPIVANLLPSPAPIQLKRPNPTPVDESVASEVKTIEIGGKVFGQKGWQQKINWPGFNSWIDKAFIVNKDMIGRVNPNVDADQEAVQKAHDDHQAWLEAAFEREKAQIQEIIKNDPEVRTIVEDIRKTGTDLNNRFTERSAKVDAVDAATNRVAAATANQQKKKAEEEAGKADTQLQEVQQRREAALKDLMEIPELLQSAYATGKEVAEKGPQAVAVSMAADKGKELAKGLIMEAYKNWADKQVAAKYDVTISNLKFKIRNLKTQIQMLEDTAAAAQAAAAASEAKAAAKELQVIDADIQNLSTHMTNTRKTLSIAIEKKYKDITVQKLQHEATAALQPLLQKYNQSLQESKNNLKELAPWQSYYSQLSQISLEEAGMEFLAGGKLPGAVRKRTPAEEANQARIQAQISKLTQWLGKLGNYVESEQIWVDSEIEKVTTGGYLDFVQEIDAKIAAML
ncbi:MAG TPA: hypothetical protein VK203_14660 [Nostocaceae cyanobacterium]|nr:hypothetical protein [Nostocaceae cyanobacterium]